jgi:hypothetical protein
MELQRAVTGLWTVPFSLSFCLSFVSPTLHAQNVGADDAASRDERASSSSSMDVNAKIEKLESALTLQQEKIAELEAFKTAVEEKEADAEFEAFSDLDDSKSFDHERWLKVYGFFDVRFSKVFAQRDNPYNLYVGSTASSFLMTSLNLFVQSQMTRSLGAIVELKFSYLPMAREDEYEYVAKLPGGAEMVQGEYVRTAPLYVDPSTSAFYASGGVYMERAHFTYTPIDWFNVIVGRFLTPYGIWNIDHSPTTILPVLTPWMLIRNAVPNSQTGLQVYGRAFFRYDLFLDYALTVSNGRHWFRLDTIQDFDENKALGLKLRLSYESKDFSISGGGYGYFGKSTDIERQVVLYLGSDMTFDPEESRPLRSNMDYTIQAMETVATADFLVEFRKVRLQSEFYWSRWEFITPPVMEANYAIFSGVPITETVIRASYFSKGYYALLSWELPLEQWISPVRVTPYFMYEFNEYMDTCPWATNHSLTGGINVKPSPFVTLKAEYFHSYPESSVYGEPMRWAQLQLAVSF